MIEEARFGELIIEHYGWGYDEEQIGNQSGELSYRYCSDEELGLANSPSATIYPIVKTSLAEVQIYRKKFKCVDQKDLVIWGDYNSAKAQQLAVKFKLCEGHDYCEPKDEILKWLRGKYIVLLYN